MPKPSFGLPSDVRVDILCGVMRAAGDPDANTLQDWLVQGAPLGMDRRIETTGVFPPADKPDKEDHSPTPDRSVLENPVDAHRELERCRAAQIAADVDINTVERLFSKGHVNKLGLIIHGIAQKSSNCDVPTQTSGSARASDAAVPELRSCLGRAILWQTGRNCFSEVASLGFTTNSGLLRKCHVRLFGCTVMFLSAFGTQAFGPSGFDQEVALMCRMGFGSKGASLTW